MPDFPDNDQERRIIRDLEAKAAMDREKPIEIMLPDHGPYIFPRIPKIDAVYIADTQTFEIFLETAKGQRLRVPIAADQLSVLKAYVDHLTSMPNQETSSEIP